MTTFQELVFFLTTAQERQQAFVGREKIDSFSPFSIGPELVQPGLYEVRDGVLVPDKQTVTVEIP